MTTQNPIRLMLFVLSMICPLDAWAEQQRVAVFVGVNSYPKPGFSTLQYAERDVELAAAEFQKLGFKTIVMKGSLPSNDPLRATRKNIVDQIKALMEPLDGDDICVVMLSGHGHQFRPEGKETEDAFYCPVDAVKTNAGTMLSLSYVIDTLLDPHVGHKLLLVDACRDAPKTDGSKGIQGSDAIRLPSKTAVLFSCSAKEQSFETDNLGNGMGTFAYCLLDGLQGKAMNSEGLLTWTGLVAHVENRMESEEVRRLAPRQNPVMAGNAGRVVLGNLSTLALAAEYVSKSTEMKLALIPAGEFLMGASDEEIAAAASAISLPEINFEHERPQRREQIAKPFYLGRFEVTQGEYREITGRTPSYFSAGGDGKDTVAKQNTDQFPVEQVSWLDAIEFCNSLSAADGFPPYYNLIGTKREAATQSITEATVNIRGGSGYRLPTEVEWEYACRAGTTAPFHFGSVLNGDKENVDGSRFPFGTKTKGASLGHPTNVNDPRYPANPFGLSGMHGNVMEWCWDNFAPLMADDREHHVFRGGSWFAPPSHARSASRDGYTSDFAQFQLGFRVARTP